MTTCRLLLASLLAPALVAAASGTAAADKPAYCTSAVTFAPRQISAVQGENAGDALRSLIGFACTPGTADGQKFADVLAAARTKWSARLGLTEADWPDVAAWVAAYSNGGTYAKVDQKAAWSALGPSEQYSAMQTSGSGGGWYGEPAYFADALGDRLTQAGRVAFVKWCVKSSNPITWAACQGDIDALDPAKLGAELRADSKAAPAVRIELRVAADDLRAELAAHADKVKALLAKDPGYGKLFAIAKDARAAFASSADPKLLELALAMDEAHAMKSNQRYAGCIDRTLPAFQAAVSSIPAKQWAALKPDPADFLYAAAPLLLDSPNTYLATMAYYACTAIEDPRDELTGHLTSAAARWPGYRGPRTAVESAILGAGIAFDDRDTKLRAPDVHRDWITGDGPGKGASRGPVAKVKPAGDTLAVEFQAKPRKEQVCTDWKDTNRIVGVTASGSLQYEYNCLKYGSITVNDGPAPRTVRTRYAAGVKPGVIAGMRGDTVVAVWPKAGEPPAFVFGAPVK